MVLPVPYQEARTMLLLQALSILTLQPMTSKCLGTEAIKVIWLKGLGKIAGLVKGPMRTPVRSLEAT